MPHFPACFVSESSGAEQLLQFCQGVSTYRVKLCDGFVMACSFLHCSWRRFKFCRSGEQIWCTDEHSLVHGRRIYSHLVLVSHYTAGSSFSPPQFFLTVVERSFFSFVFLLIRPFRANKTIHKSIHDETNDGNRQVFFPPGTVYTRRHTTCGGSPLHV